MPVVPDPTQGAETRTAEEPFHRPRREAEQRDERGVPNHNDTQYLLINFLKQNKSNTIVSSTRINGLPEFEAQFKEVCERVDRTFFEETEDPDEDGEKSRILGDFKILREIDSGGMATVYEAEQCSLKRKVALKLLPSHLRYSEEAIRKFRREAEAGGRQRHPGIVSVYAVGELEGLPCLQVGRDLLPVYPGLGHVGDQHKDDICFRGCLRNIRPRIRQPQPSPMRLQF